MTISQYLERLQAGFKLGNATEHTYRGYLQTLLESIATGVTVTNEPARIKCGAPDYILTRNEIPVGYIEAKDIGKDIRHKDYKEQFDRYKKSLNNLIITDYLEFELYIDGDFKTKVKIAELHGNNISPLPQHFEEFTAFIRSFCTHVGQTIKSSQKLAIMMADKAKLLSQVIENALNSDVENEENSTLKDQMYAFKDILIHDIKPRDFADIYAQTIAYGMFAARLHDPTLPTFSRQEAAELIPKTNPFLRKLFQYIAAVDLDSRIAWIVDALADIFRATDVAALLKNFGKATQTNDPIIHFYETFLAEYDPALRKARGVWYTPEPVVNFIVRAVDDILKTEFNLPQGIADNSKIKVKRKVMTKATTDMRSRLKEVEVEEEVHRVQILDPATGTGTFLAEAIKHIYKRFAGQQGIWSNYVENHLIPRINGFELLMASYAMAHLKLDLLLTETGYKATRDQRFRVYLTNSLEEHHADTGTLFANWLSSEANEANHIKRDTPVMVVMGNPPYSISSSNKSIGFDGHKTWIGNLIDEYKKNLNERKINLDDDYIKFIRFGHFFIEKNGEGILAYISNNSFLDGVTHRQMRKSLLKTFDKVFILDLHGNSRKKELTPEGHPDQNVFDIMQGVSINIFVKNNKKEIQNNGQIFHVDFWGKREKKYADLSNATVSSLSWKHVIPDGKYCFYVPKSFDQDDYNNGFKLTDLFTIYSVGIKTKIDNVAVSFDSGNLKTRVKDILDNKYDLLTLNSIYDIGLKTTWEYKVAYQSDYDENRIEKYDYRPFDTRFTYYENKFLSRSRSEVMDNFYKKENIGIEISRTEYPVIFISKNISDEHFGGQSSYKLPLLIYSKKNAQLSTRDEQEYVSNLSNDILQKVAEGLRIIYNKDPIEDAFAPIDILDYIYAVLHSPVYREKYKEFLKIDFPRVPYPKDSAKFWQLVKLGGEIRQLHLLESREVDNYITSYPQDGNNVVTALRYDAGKVYINDNQYFDGVPQGTWQFYIGGYQPAQKWLKDRKGRELSFDDILHYHRMIVALTETQRLMVEIDKVGVE